eukprot:5683651-Pleurochrysis_carterae.AAC.2
MVFGVSITSELELSCDELYGLRLGMSGIFRATDEAISAAFLCDVRRAKLRKRYAAQVEAWARQWRQLHHPMA